LVAQRLNGRKGGLAAIALLLLGLVIWRGGLAEQPGSSAPLQGPNARLTQTASPSLAQPRAISRGRIAGRVTFEKRPLGGALVRVEPDPKVGGEGPRELKTDQAGAFDFGELVRSAYFVSASAPTLTRAMISLDLRAASTRSDKIELELTGCEARLSGRILDAAGGGIVHAQVRLLGSAGTFSGVDGAYDLCVPLGAIEVMVDADGYGPMRFTVLAAALTKRDFILVPAGSLVGRVVRGPSNLPVPGAQVTAHSATPGPDQTALVSSPTDSEGRFNLVVAPGRHLVNAVAPDGASTVMPAVATVLAGQTSQEIVLRLTPSAVRVAGVVRHRGVAVSGAQVMSISKAVATRAQGVTGSDGRFELNAVLPGETMFNVAGHKVVAPKSVSIQGPDAFVELEVERGASLRGTISRAGQPVSGARVTARAGVVPQITTSAPNGAYALDGLEPGHFEVFAQSELLGAFGREELDLADNEAGTLDLDLKHGGSIAGTVTSEGGPVAGAKVIFKHTRMDDDGLVVTDEKGVFKCTQLVGGGVYEAFVYSPGGAELAQDGARTAVELVDGSAHLDGVRISVAFGRAKIQGRVVDQAGDPVPDAQVRATSDDLERDSPLGDSAAVPTDQRGRFSIDVAANHSWTVSARGPDGSQGSRSGVSSGGTETEIRVRAGGLIVGQLLGFTVQPILYAVVSGDDERALLGQVDRGSFRIPVPAGLVMVTAMSASEGASQRVDVAPGTTTSLTLTASGSARVSGTVTEHGTNAPVPGMACHALMRSGGTIGLTNWSLEAAAQTDALGAFQLAECPAGDIAIVCVGNGNVISSGSASLSVSAEGQADVLLEVVRRSSSSAPGDIGIRWVPGDTGVEVGWVQPGSSGASANLGPGEVALAVDGLSVERLNAFGMTVLVQNHPPGSSLQLTTRSGGQRRTRTLVVRR
jgi:hypothetical protein